jgi:hypothetical protein
VLCLFVRLRNISIILPPAIYLVHSDAAKSSLPLSPWKQAASCALHNCGYETAGVAQDAETCLEIKSTATSDWHIAEYLPFQHLESPAGTLLKAVYIFDKLRGVVTGLVNGELERVQREK